MKISNLKRIFPAATRNPGLSVDPRMETIAEGECLVHPSRIDKVARAVASDFFPNANDSMHKYGPKDGQPITEMLKGKGKKGKRQRTNNVAPVQVEIVCFFYTNSQAEVQMLFALAKEGLKCNGSTLTWEGKRITDQELQQDILREHRPFLTSICIPFQDRGLEYDNRSPKFPKFIYKNVVFNNNPNVTLILLDERVPQPVPDFVGKVWEDFRSAAVETFIATAPKQPIPMKPLADLEYFLIHTTEMEARMRAQNDGLTNGGNLCWFNSFLQILASSSSFVASLVDESESIQHTAIKALALLLQCLQTRQSATHPALIAEGFTGRQGWTQYLSRLRTHLAQHLLRTRPDLLNGDSHCFGETETLVLELLREHCPKTFLLYVGVMRRNVLCLKKGRD